jgi:hypothetical protein
MHTSRPSEIPAIPTAAGGLPSANTGPKAACSRSWTPSRADEAPARLSLRWCQSGDGSRGA